MTALERMTFEDLMAQTDDGCLHELVRGEILRVPPPKTKHGYVEAELIAAIDHYLNDRAHNLGWEKSQGRSARHQFVGRLMGGEAGVRFTLPDDPDQVRGVDVGYLSPEQVARLADVPTDEYIRDVPALVVEVISLSESATYINEKAADYLKGGAQVVWLLYPKTRTAMVMYSDDSAHTVPPDGSLDGGAVLPGFSEELANIFA